MLHLLIIALILLISYFLLKALSKFRSGTLSKHASEFSEKENVPEDEVNTLGRRFKPKLSVRLKSSIRVWLQAFKSNRFHDVNDRKGDGLHSIFTDRPLDSPAPSDIGYKHSLKTKRSISLNEDQNLIYKCLYKWGIFSGFEYSLLDEIYNITTTIFKSKNDIIFSYSHPSDKLYILKSGKCAIIFTDENHIEKEISQIRAGEAIANTIDIIAWILRSNVPRHITLKCLEDCEILVIPSLRSTDGKFPASSHESSFNHVLQLLLVCLNRTTITTSFFYLGLAEHLLPCFEKVLIPSELLDVVSILQMTNNDMNSDEVLYNNDNDNDKKNINKYISECISELFMPSLSHIFQPSTSTSTSTNSLHSATSHSMKLTTKEKKPTATAADSTATSVTLLRRAMSLDSLMSHHHQRKDGLLSTSKGPPPPPNTTIFHNNNNNSNSNINDNNNINNIKKNKPYSYNTSKSQSHFQRIDSNISVRDEDSLLPDIVCMNIGESIHDIDAIPGLYIIITGTVHVEFIHKFKQNQKHKQDHQHQHQHQHDYHSMADSESNEAKNTALGNQHNNDENENEKDVGNNNDNDNDKENSEFHLFQLWDNSYNNKTSTSSPYVDLCSGCVLGHIALIAGNSVEWYGTKQDTSSSSSNAILRATAYSKTYLIRIPRKYHEHMCRIHTQSYFSIAERMISNLPPIIRLFDICSKWIKKDGGNDLIVARSTIATSLYVLLSGKMQLIPYINDYEDNYEMDATSTSTPDSSPKKPTHHHSYSGNASSALGCGALIGGTELLSGQTFSHTVRAMRACTLASVPGITCSVPLDLFCSLLSTCMCSTGLRIKILTSTLAYGVLGSVFDCLGEEELYLSVGAWMQSCEADNDLLLYQCDWQADSAWNRLCVSHADELLLVANSGDSPHIGAAEHGLVNVALHIPKTLVLLHIDPPPATAGYRPRDTRRWIEARCGITRHFHVRLHSDDLHYDSENYRSDFARLGRILSDTAALEDAHIPVDFIGGTSMGAFVGALYASQDQAELVRVAAEEWASGMGSLWSYLKDLTLPITSYFNGYNFTFALRQCLGVQKIEDLWLSYCKFSSSSSTSFGVFIILLA
eukprot:gene10417-21725_t